MVAEKFTEQTPGLDASRITAKVARFLLIAENPMSVLKVLTM
jgi:hypothetical protein